MSTITPFIQEKDLCRILIENIQQAVQINQLIYNEIGEPVDYLILDINHAVEKHIGLKREEIIGKMVKEILPAAEQEWFIRYGEVVKTGKPARFEMYDVLLDQWDDVQVISLGCQNKFGILFQDITELKNKKEAEKNAVAALRESEKLILDDLEAMKRIQAISTSFVQYVDFNLLLREILETVINISGAQKGTLQLVKSGTEDLEIVEQSGFEQDFIELFSSASHDTTDVCAEAFKKKERVIVKDVVKSSLFAGTPALKVQLNAGVRAVQSTPLVNRKGELIGILSTHWVYPFCPDDRVLRYIDLLARQAADIIEKKKDEEVLRESEKKQGILLKISDTLRHLSEPEEIHSVITQSAMEIFNADRCYYCEIENDKAIIRRDAFRGDLQSVAGVYPLNSLPIQKSLIEEGKPFIVNNVYTTDIDEALRQLCIQLKVISYIDVPVVKNGKPVGLLCVVQSSPRNWTNVELELAVEISIRVWEAVERARVEQALLRAERDKYEAFQKSIEMKDDFLSIISHEFKTPITVISSAIQAMKLVCRDELSDKVNQYLCMILQNTNRQLKLVNNLLDITSINASSIKLNLTNMDIILTTRTIIESIKVFAEQKDIKLSFSSTIEEKIIGIDEEKYERILLNLLSNAIKFTPRGKSIFIRVFQKVVKRKSYICIQVKDQGIGIPLDKQQLIFERFGQVDSSLSRNAEGTGIGLSLVKMFVESMGGDITVESEVGKGSAFTVLLPISKKKETTKEKMLYGVNDNRLIQATAIEFSDVY